MTLIVTVHQHRKPMDNHRVFSIWVQTKVNQYIVDAPELSQIDIYNMNGSSHIIAGTSNQLVIMGHDNNRVTDDVEIKIGDSVVASYYNKRDRGHMLRIHSDIFGTFTQENKNLFEAIMIQLNSIYAQAQLDYSWKSTTKKEQLTAEFTNTIKQQQSRYITEDKRQIERVENDIRMYMQELKNRHDQRTRLANQIEVAESKLEAVSERLIKDLDNIIANPKVKELFIKDGKFIVHTVPLYIHHDQTGDRYYLGNMRIEMNPQNTEVKFFGDNPRKSYWSTEDPHPHVSSSGSACLGNVSSTIAELCSQMELYALTMIGIDFLESVNTSDPAGRNITNWDKVDDEGNIIEKGSYDIDEDEDAWTCEHCDERQPGTDDSIRVYAEYEAREDINGDLYDEDYGTEMYVCASCQENHYPYRDRIDEYVRNGEYTIHEDEEEEE